MKKTWEVDADTTIVAQYGLFSKKAITVNGEDVVQKFSVRKKREFAFALSNERQARIKVSRPFVGQPAIELNVDGALVAELGKYPVQCKACGTTANSYDSFCAKCGQAMPTAEHRANKGVVAEATKTISVLSGLFLLFGIISYFMTQSKLAPTIAKLQSLDPNAVFPTPINGTYYKVTDVIAQLNWEIRGVFIVNAILATVMVLLAIWSKRAPLPAILVATATYAVVLVASAIVDPTTIAQGIVVKIIVIGFLIRGVKAALVLRATNA